MSKTGRPIGFDIEEMLKLRFDGWTTIALGERYGRDRTTITHHCQKYGVTPFGVKREITIRTRIVIQPPSKPRIPGVIPKYAHLLDERVNPGKSYKEYLRDALKRQIEQNYKRQFGNIFYVPKNIKE